MNRLREQLLEIALYRDGRWLSVVMAFSVTFVAVVLVGVILLPDTPRRHPSPRPGAAAVPPPRLPGGAPASIVPFTPPNVAAIRAPDRAAFVRRRVAAARPLPQVQAEALAPAPASPPAERVEQRAGKTSAIGDANAPQAPPHGSQPASGGVVKVTGIALWGTPARPWSSITTTGPVRYQVRAVHSDWVVVDLYPAQLALSSGRPPAGFGRIAQVRAGQFNGTTVRVVLELTAPASVRIVPSRDRSGIIVNLTLPPGETVSTGRNGRPSGGRG